MSANLALGCWQFAGTFGFWENQNREDSIRTIHAALRGGVRHFDTAQAYGNGRSEQLVGQQLRRFKDIPRNELTIATKLMPTIPTKIEDLVNTSLRRLCTSYIDILYLHWPSSKMDILPMLKQMEALKKAGSIHAIGVSNLPLSLLDSISSTIKIDWLQRPASLLWTYEMEETLSLCKTRDIKTAAYSPIGMGLLNGKTRCKEDLSTTDARRNLYCLSDDAHACWNRLQDEILKDCQLLDMSPTQLALAWTASQGFDTVVCGARTKEQLTLNLNAMTREIPKDIMKRLDELSKELNRHIPITQDNMFDHAW